MRTVLKNAIVVNPYENPKKADVVFEDKVISVEREYSGNADRVMDCSGKIVMPGLINAHTHVAMTIFRGYGEGLPLHEWLTKKIWPAEAKLGKTEVERGALLGAMECALSGCVAINDMYLKHTREIGMSCSKIGIKSVVSYGAMDRINGKSVDDELREIRKCADELSRIDLCRPAVSCHSPYACSKEMIMEAYKESNNMGVPFHIHASETRKEVFDCLRENGKRPIEYLEECGALAENTIVAHASWTTKREIKKCGDAFVSIAHCPTSNLKLATGGICPVKQYIESGANVCLGTDGPSSNNSMDQIETMKLSALLQIHKYWDPLSISPDQIIASATINGAKALGTGGGMVKEGYNADILVLDPEHNMVPMHDPKTAIIYSANRRNVLHLFVDGRAVVENKKLATIDWKKEVEKCLKTFEKFFEKL